MPGRSRASWATGTIPRSSLPLDSATSCSAQSPKDSKPSSDTNVSLSPLFGKNRHPDTKRGGRILLDIKIHRHLLGHGYGSVENLGNVDANKRRRHQAKIGQRREPPADIYGREKYPSEDIFFSQLLKRTARIRDRDKLLTRIFTV